MVSRAHVAILAALVGVVALIGVFGAEHIGVHEGYGWDGNTYREILRHPATEVAARRVDSYTLQRVLPSFVVGAVLSAAGVEQSGARVARAFGIYDTLLLVTCALLWGSAARLLQLSRRAFYLGAIALFATFANTKQVSYNPVLTDTTAFTLGLALVVAFLARSRIAVAVIALLGSFAWPVALPLSIPLILWPRGTPPVRGGSRWLAVLIAGGIALAFVGVFAYLHWVKGRMSAGMGPVIPIIPQLVPLSLLAFGVIAFASLYTLLRGIDARYAVDILRAVRPQSVAIAAVVAATVAGLISTYAARDVAPPLPVRTFLGMLVITPTTRPLIAMAAHFSYYGPWILLVVAIWPRVAARIQAEGPGLLAFACGTTILALLPESREAIFGVPLLAAFCAAASDEIAIPRPAIVVMTVIAIGLTRFWVRYGEANTPDAMAHRDYLSAHGPYMQTRDYLIFAAIAVVSAVAMWMCGMRPWATRARSAADDAFARSADTRVDPGP